MQKVRFFEKFIEARPELLRSLSQRVGYHNAEDLLQDVCVQWLERSYWKKVKNKNLDGLFWSSAIKNALLLKRAEEARKARESAFYETYTEDPAQDYLVLCSKFDRL